MKQHIYIKKIDLKEKDNQQFISNDIQSLFKIAMSQWVSDIFIAKIENKVVSFCFLMKEDLECGFLHYHIQDEFKLYFIKKYPMLHQKTNQVLYIYTSENFRKKGIATDLLNFVIQNLKNKNYHFLWLKKETSSNIYDNLDFFNFIEILEVLKIKENFLDDYKKICNLNEQKLLQGFGDIRLVKIL